MGAQPDCLPASCVVLVERALQPGETPLASFEPDLDDRMRYAPGLVVLTDRRILAFAWREAARPDQRTGEPTRGEWTLQPGMELLVRGDGPIGSLELHGPGQRLARWRYTAGRAAGAHRIADCHAAGPAAAPSAQAYVNSPETTECPVCGSPVPAGVNTCRACDAAKPNAKLRSLLRLALIARRYWPMCALGFLLTLAGTALGLVPPYLTMPLLDGILVPYQSGKAVDTGAANWYLLGLAAASVLACGLSWAQMYVVAWVSERIAADLRRLTFSHLQRLSLEYFGGRRTGDLISRIGTDTDRICFYLSVYVLDFGTDVLMLLMTAAILLKIDASLAAVTLLPMPFIAVLAGRVQGRLARGFSVGNRAWAELTSILADSIPGIRVIKAFAQEERETERLQRANERVLRANDRVNRVWAYFNAVVVLLTDVGVLVVWAAGVWRVFHASVTVGVLAAFVAYITRFYSRLDSMSRMASSTERAAASARRVFAVLDRAPGFATPANPVHPGRVRGSVELRDVSFRYGTAPVLRNIDLLIRPGEMVGLVGHSGAGKTTLINLICRFYDVTGGAVLVDGTDIRQFPVEEFRRNIGLVLQEPFLFFGTVAENIAYGRPDATREEIIAAARAARAHEFILRLPHGYDSLVGERGQFLSGGERQRVSIARALLVDPRILILDEATSSVDSETEREIQMALENLVRGRTTIAIAHRLSTLQQADRLVVLEHGRVVEMGRHSELVGRGGPYSRLYETQLDGTRRGRPHLNTARRRSRIVHVPPRPDGARTVNPAFERDSRGRLILIETTGRRIAGVVPVRAFPLSEPRRSISIVDAGGHELLYIESLDDLDAPAREMIEAELRDRQFVPVIVRILNTPPDTEPAAWEVMTDRGFVAFDIETGDCVHRGARGISIVDSHGIRYDVADLRKLVSCPRNK